MYLRSMLSSASNVELVISGKSVAWKSVSGPANWPLTALNVSRAETEVATVTPLAKSSSSRVIAGMT